MKLVHFGEHTLSSPQQMVTLLDEVEKHREVCAVVSPLSGVCDQLQKIIQDNDSGGNLKTEGRMRGLISYHIAFAEVLLPRGDARKSLIDDLQTVGENLINTMDRKVGFELEALLLDTATHWSSLLVYYMMLKRGMKSELLLSRSFLRLNSEESPDVMHSRFLYDEFASENAFDYLVVQGGSILGMDSLPHALPSKSAGTAAAFALALGIPQIDVWHHKLPLENNDIKFVSESSPVRQLTFTEAIELNSSEIQILHSQCLKWLDDQRASIYLRSVLRPSDEGIRISGRQELPDGEVKIIRSTSNMVSVRVECSGLQVYSSVESILAQFGVEPYSVSASGGIISLVIPQHRHLYDVIEELNRLGGTNCSQNLCLIELVGHDLIRSRTVSSKLMEALGGIPFRLIFAGHSDHKLVAVIDNKYRTEALNQLHHAFFQVHNEPVAWLN